MVVVDTLFHKWMVHYFPMCQPVSYVDDWQIVVSDPQRIQGVFACLEAFVGEIDLLLDSRKTHTWSLHATGRALMREQVLVPFPMARTWGHTSNILNSTPIKP